MTRQKAGGPELGEKFEDEGEEADGVGVACGLVPMTVIVVLVETIRP